MSATGRPGASGFTLIEMLVVLAILGLIGGVVYPGLARGLRGQELRAAAVAATSAMREGRARALRGDAAVVVAARPDARGFRIGSQALPPVAASIAVTTQPGSGIVFYPDGTSSGGTLLVANQRDRIRFGVTATTGLVRALAR